MTFDPPFVMNYLRFLVPILLCACSAKPASVAISVLDGSGAPLKNVLVIVKSLDRAEGEVCRSLTDLQGHAPACRTDVSAGLYRAIATTPYGPWKTSVVEFVVDGTPKTLMLSMSPQPTHGYGDIVPVGILATNIEVLQSTGEPARNVQVLVRDEDATPYLERWYKTDASGKAKIELVGHPTVVVILSGRLLVTRGSAATLPPRQSGCPLDRRIPNSRGGLG